MKKIIPIIILIIAMIAAYYYWQRSQPESEVTPTQQTLPSLPVEGPVPAVRQVIETPAKEVSPLPGLSESDSFILEMLADLTGNKSLMSFFHTEQVIYNIVATIDNLPRDRAPMKTMPIVPASGNFIVAVSKGEMFISPKNAERYIPYIKFAETVDPKALVELYVRIYPLFQKAYEELGYPDKYFNDRLMVAMDNLLAAPDIKEPVQLAQPKFYYKFADPDLENRSIGQRILMRIGSDHEKIIKAKLGEIRKELLLHMHEEEVVIAN